MIYAGLVAFGLSRRMEVFESSVRPTRKTHPRFITAVGPFETLAGARYAAGPGEHDPNCNSIADAERLSR